MRKVRWVLAGMLSCAMLSMAGNGLVETITSTSAADTTTQLTATSVKCKGWVEQITLKCGTAITGTVAVTSVPGDTSIPSYSVLSTNGATGNLALFPRTSAGDRYFVWGEAFSMTVTNVSTTNVTFQATIKLSLP